MSKKRVAESFQNWWKDTTTQTQKVQWNPKRKSKKKQKQKQNPASKQKLHIYQANTNQMELV